MLDARMQEAYLSSFQYDDIDSAALPGEIDCTPRVGDEGALFLDYPDGSGDAEELMFRVGVMDSGLPVIELRTSADDDWDEVRPCFFDEISLRNGMVLTLRSRTPAAHSPGYPYGMTEDDPKLFDLDTEDEQHGTRAAQWLVGAAANGMVCVPLGIGVGGLTGGVGGALAGGACAAGADALKTWVSC